MININLSPGSGPKKKAPRKQAVDIGAVTSGFNFRLRDKYMIGAIAAVVISAGAVGFLFTTQTAREAILNTRRESAVADSTRYANFLKDRYHAESVRDTILRQVNIIKSLDDDRFIWPHILDEVSRVIPQYTWLTAVATSGTPQGSTNVVAAPKADTSAAARKHGRSRLETDIPKDPVAVRIQGHTVDIQALTRFWKDLESSPFLTNVQLDRSELAMELGKEVTQFQLTLAYNRPDSMAVRRLPLSLMVR
ncbi:MAG TPA: PilN domain-containing protein [Gemmatimonadaceae bacterium]|nr:PilN domain-containing protein [Gemmatimonadaceae bacterium]